MSNIDRIQKSECMGEYVPSIELVTGDVVSVGDCVKTLSGVGTVIQSTTIEGIRGDLSVELQVLLFEDQSIIDITSEHCTKVRINYV